jgi:hypothetical protein
MSESPLIRPLVPLGKFVKQLGPPPEHKALRTYLARLREQGWEVTPTINRLLQCGESLHPEVPSP